MLQQGFYHPSAVTSERVCRYGQFWDLPGSHSALIRTVQQLKNENDLAEFVERQHEIDVPSLILFGAHDPLVPPTHAEKLRTVLRNSQIAPPVEAGHVPHEECPEVTANLIDDFLRP